MKKETHPTYYKDTKFVCTCGATYNIGSTHKDIVKVEVCASCHPFYTGKQKLVDSSGRVDRFKRIQQKKVELEKNNY